MEAIEMREENDTATGIEMRNSVLDRDKLQVNNSKWKNKVCKHDHRPRENPGQLK